MRLRVFIWIFLLAVFGRPGGAAEAFGVQQVASGVFVHFGQALALDVPGHDDIANIGFVVGARCVAVIDTGGSVRIGRALRAAIRHKTTLPVCYVINTHVHFDHVLGNLAFAADQPSFIGHHALRAAMAGSRAFFLDNYGADLDAPASAQQIIGPDRGVDVGSELELDLGGRKLRLQAWPKAHTDCDLSVLDEQTDTLWTGDLLFRDRLPALDGSITGWLGAIDALERSHPAHFVPGHGAAGDDLRAALVPERRYLKALLDGVRAEIAQGKPIDDAMAQVAKVEKPHWLLWQGTHQHNVARAYQELEWE